MPVYFSFGRYRMHNKNLVAVVQSLIVTVHYHQHETKRNETKKKQQRINAVLPPLSLRTLKENNDGCPGGAYPVREKNRRK